MKSMFVSPLILDGNGIINLTRSQLGNLGVGDEIVAALLSAGKTGHSGDVNINVEVSGAENPEEWARKFVKQMRLEMRTV